MSAKTTKKPAAKAAPAAAKAKKKPALYSDDRDVFKRARGSALPAYKAVLPDETPEPQSEKVESVALDLIEPDVWQGRRILPDALQTAYHRGELSAEQAVREWISRAQRDAAARVRLDECRVVAASIEELGQINPTTVIPIAPTPRGTKYRIESGERRFWSSWIRALEMGGDRTIKVVIRDAFSSRRQAEENSTQSPLNAVALARTVARVFLAELKITPEESPLKDLTPGSNEFFRLALWPASQLLGDGRERYPRGTWIAVERALGRKSTHLERLLQILALPDEALIRADESNLSERVLRAVIEAHVTAERQVLVVVAASERGLSADQVTRLCLTQDFEQELARVQAEAPVLPPVVNGRPPKAKRASPAQRSSGIQLADRITSISRTVRAYAKGQAVSEGQAIEMLVDDALRLKPKDAQEWLPVLELLVVKLRALRLSDGKQE